MLAACGIGAFVYLGIWQTHRGLEKQAQVTAFLRGDGVPAVPYGSSDGRLRYAHVRLEGHFDAERQVLLDNMTHGGRVGYRVLTPLRTTLGVVLVDRGWVPAPARREELPSVAVGGDLRVVTGRLDLLPRAGIALPTVPGGGWPRRLSYPDLASLQRAYGEPIEPQIVLLDAAAADGYVRDWHPGGLPPERHYGYAVQWYGLALAVLAIYLVVNLKRHGQPS